MSAIAVIGTVLLGLASAYVIARMRFRGKTAMDIAIMLPWALPGTVVAINLITAFANPSVFAFGRVLVGTFAIVPLSYVVRFSPLVFRSTAASLAQLDVGIEEAARSLGATWWYAFRRVVLPLLYRGILGGALLAFVNGVGEFVATILLYTPQYRPLSIAINDELYFANYGTGRFIRRNSSGAGADRRDFDAAGFGDGGRRPSSRGEITAGPERQAIFRRDPRSTRHRFQGCRQSLPSSNRRHWLKPAW
jgi:ABC-type molybdate transport system permease subunit